MVRACTGAERVHERPEGLVLGGAFNRSQLRSKRGTFVLCVIPSSVRVVVENLVAFSVCLQPTFGARLARVIQALLARWAPVVRSIARDVLANRCVEHIV